VVANPEQDRQWVAKGFRMVVYSGDIWLLGGALRAAAGVSRRIQRATFTLDRPEVNNANPVTIQ
jgi:hypothetical protein